MRSSRYLVVLFALIGLFIYSCNKEEVNIEPISNIEATGLIVDEENSRIYGSLTDGQMEEILKKEFGHIGNNKDEQLKLMSDYISKKLLALRPEVDLKDGKSGQLTTKSGPTCSNNNIYVTSSTSAGRLFGGSICFENGQLVVSGTATLTSPSGSLNLFDGANFGPSDKIETASGDRRGNENQDISFGAVSLNVYEVVGPDAFGVFSQGFSRTNVNCTDEDPRIYAQARVLRNNTSLDFGFSGSLVVSCKD